MNSKSKKLWQLFSTFFRIGAFTFGGGYAMIPFIQRETVEHHHWISEDDILEVVAIAESTPGPIAVNAATFVGYKVCGVAGACLATLGVVLPSLIIIYLLSMVLDTFGSLKAVKYAFFGIRAGVLALLCKALFSVYKKCPKSAFSYGAAIAALLLSSVFGINAIYIVILCGVLGIVMMLLAERRKRA